MRVAFPTAAVATLLLAVVQSPLLCAANTTESWIAKRAALIHDVYGKGPGVLPTKSVPDAVLTWPSDPGLQGLVWNMTTLFPITSTVFYSPVTPGKTSKTAFMFHHGHSDCVCAGKAGSVAASKCQPGCNSSMPSLKEIGDPGYSWWDLYNVSNFFHSLGHDVFILSMPLKGINIGPGSTASHANSDHWWFLQWEQKGDHALRYFLEPAVLTVNWAKARGYEEIYMAGLSGGGWSTTFAAAIDSRIAASFPIAGSVPCAMRNPEGPEPGQNWTGSDAEDFEQSCRRPGTGKEDPGKEDGPGRPAQQACNYTCQYLLAGLEPSRFQVQILHEYDTCCFSPHDRHDQMLAYEANVRAELSAQSKGHGWFTSAADNHSKHEVCAQDKTIIAAAMAGRWQPGASNWEEIPCDIMHQKLPAKCAQNVDPGLPPGYKPNVPPVPSPRSAAAYFAQAL